MQLVFVTGMSGAGKSQALKILEDLGFEAIDNLPLHLLSTVIEASQQRDAKRLALGVDVRSRDFTPRLLQEVLANWRTKLGSHVHLLFLDSDDEVLQRRFSETRRPHPLAKDRQVADGIATERALIGPLKSAADVIIDTSELKIATLRQMLIGHLIGDEKKVMVSVMSFSFRQGVPREADIVFDARFLRNPHHSPELRPMSGLEAKAAAYIEEDPDFKKFFLRISEMFTELLPRYGEEGKHYMTIAIGCTGGRHRSVFVAQKLAGFLEKSGYNVHLRHRDVDTVT